MNNDHAQRSNSSPSTALKAGTREWIGLAVLALPTMLVSMDLTVLYLAVPALSADLKPTGSQLLWITDIYGFLVAGLLVTMGTLGDRVGRRRVLLSGAAAFGLASILAAFSRSAEMLIAARAFLGIAGSTLLPSTLSLIRNMFHDERQRTLAIGIWTTSFSLGTVAGPLIGGMVLAHFWWGAVFLVSVPVMLLLLASGPRLLPEFRNPGSGRFDLFSAGQSIAGTLAVIYGLKRMAEDGPGWVPGLVIAAGLVILWIFAHRQRTLNDPLLDLRLFQSAAFSASVAAMTLALFVWAGTYLFVAQYLQLVLGKGPFEAGLWLVPSAFGGVAGCLLAPVLVRHFRSATVVTAGMVVGAAGLLMLLLLNTTSNLAILVTTTVALSFGVGLVVTLSTDLIVASAPPERAGAAAAVSETGSEFGGALGIAILGSTGTAVYRGAMADLDARGVPLAVLDSAKATLAGAVSAAEQLSNPDRVLLLEVAERAFTRSMQIVGLLAAIILLAVSVVFFALVRRGR